MALATATANSPNGDVTATTASEADETVAKAACEDEGAVPTGKSKPAAKLLLVERPGNPVPSIIQPGFMRPKATHKTTTQQK